MSTTISELKRVSTLLFCVFSAYALLFSGHIPQLHAQERPSTNVVTQSTTSAAAKRFALVIGNGAYRNVPSLKNAKNDAAAMAAKLEKVGYEVLYVTDLDRRSMNQAVTTFLARIEPGSEALVYYAGHGVELNGSNYLLPIDIPALSPDQERMLRTEGANLTDLLLDLEARSARVTLVILDACRDNPFREANSSGTTRSLGSTRGLGRVDPPRGTFVIFSAGVGEQAIDNLGSEDTNPNGLFTRKLLTLLDQDGLEIRPMVQRLRAEVRQAALSGTGRSQIPSYYDQLLGEFYFHPKSQVGEGPGENSCDRLVDPNASAVSLLKADLNAGLQACAAATIQYPNEMRFVRQLQAAQEQQMAQKALSSNQSELSSTYLLLYPNGRFAGDVKAHISTLGASPRIKPIPDEPKKAPDPVPPAPTVVPQLDVARVLQAELKRVGCDPNAVDGSWGSGSVRAMTTYNRITHANLDTAKPTIAALEILRSNQTKVCPLACRNGERETQGQCVKIVCPSGTNLSRSGMCIKVFTLPHQRRHQEISKPIPPNKQVAQRVVQRVSPFRRLGKNHTYSSGDGLTPRTIGGCTYFNGISNC